MNNRRRSTRIKPVNPVLDISENGNDGFGDDGLGDHAAYSAIGVEENLDEEVKEIGDVEDEVVEVEVEVEDDGDDEDEEDNEDEESDEDEEGDEEEEVDSDDDDGVRFMLNKKKRAKSST
jgi:hypothetical protein